MSYLTLYSRTSDHRDGAVDSTEDERAHASFTTPSRTRSDTSVSQAVHPYSNAFQASTPRSTRRNTASSSFSPMLGGVPPSGLSQLRNGLSSFQKGSEAATSVNYADPASHSMSHRRISTNTLPPFRPIASPALDILQSTIVSLDWKSLYRDRYELERRWEEGRFTTRTLKDHEVSLRKKKLF